MTSDYKIEIATRFDTHYFFIESFKKQKSVPKISSNKNN